MNTYKRANDGGKLPVVFSDSDIVLMRDCPQEVGAAEDCPRFVTISCANSHQTNVFRPRTLPFSDFLVEMMRHESGAKRGTAWSAFQFGSGRRNASNSDFTQLLVYDCDSGMAFEEIKQRLLEAGYAGVIVSTHSHMSEITTVRKDRLAKWLKQNPESGAENFLKQKGIIENIAKTASDCSHNDLFELLDTAANTVEIRHAPCPRFRVILFLKEPWERSAFSDNDRAVERYKKEYKSVAESLDLDIDLNACDVARAFFYPRHEKKRSYVAEFVGGRTVGSSDMWEDPEHFQLPEKQSINSLHHRTPDDAELERLVMAIKNDDRFDDRNTWCSIGAAIWNVTGASDFGRSLFHKWSGKWSGGYDPDETERVWSSFRSRPAGLAAGMGTLIHFARQDGFGFDSAGNCELVPHGDIWHGYKFSERHRNRYVFVSATGQWLGFEGVRWTVVPETDIERLAKDLSRDILRSTLEGSDKNSLVSGSSDYQKAAAVHASLPRVRRIFESAKSEPGMAVPDPALFDVDPLLFGVENGVVDLRTGRLRQSHPTDYISKAGHVLFDENASAPMFLDFLNRVIPEKSVRAFLQRAVGYILTGSVVEERVFFFWGSGANGKSVFGNILAALLGEYAVSLGSSLVAKNKHDNEAERLKARLPGARLAQVNELGQGDIWDDQRLKELASRERISARFLHREAFEFFPTHKLLIRGNYLLGAHDAGDGFWRRLVPIEFGVQIPEEQRIPDLDRKVIETELAGVLN